MIGGTGSEIKNRLNNARDAFRMLDNVWRSSQDSSKTKLKIYQSCVMSTLPYGSECWRMTERNTPCCQSSTQRTSFDLTPSPTNSYSPAVVKTAWRPSSCEGDRDGLGTARGESRTTSFAQPFTGHLKESARGDDQETADAKLSKQSWRPCNTLGVPSRSWPGTDTRGGPSQPPYVPCDIMGMSEWICYPNSWTLNFI